MPGNRDKQCRVGGCLLTKASTQLCLEKKKIGSRRKKSVNHTLKLDQKCLKHTKELKRHKQKVNLNEVDMEIKD